MPRAYIFRWRPPRDNQVLTSRHPQPYDVTILYQPVASRSKVQSSSSRNLTTQPVRARASSVDAMFMHAASAANGCSMAARHRGSLCEAHYADSVLDKNALPIIYQYFPDFLQTRKHDRIRWTCFRSEIATWINRNLTSAPSVLAQNDILKWFLF